MKMEIFFLRLIFLYDIIIVGKIRFGDVDREQEHIHDVNANSKQDKMTTRE